MITLTYKENAYPLHEGETVLEVLLKNGFSIPNACRNGVCQSCLLQAEEGDPGPEAQQGLKNTQVDQGYFLACQSQPQENLTIKDTGHRVHAVIEEKTPLNSRVMKIKIRLKEPFPYKPGQFVHLIRKDGLLRPYSLASVPERDTHLEIHVLLVPEGQMSHWLFYEAKPREEIQIQGPSGSCFYLQQNLQQPILLAGTGTGLAPLFGIAQDALRQGHTGPIYLLHGAVQKEQLYFVDDLRRLAVSHANFFYTPCVLQGESVEGGVVGHLTEQVLNVSSSFNGWSIYLCGNPEIVKELRTKTFLQGASPKNIYVDSFFFTPAQTCEI